MKHFGSLLMVAGALLVLFYPTMWVYGKVGQIYLHHQWAAQSRNGVKAAGSKQVCRLLIPRIWVDQVVIEGVGDSQLTLGPGHFPETAMPGEGNCVIAGHLNINGSPFKDLDTLTKGDVALVQTDSHLLHYQFEAGHVIRPDDTDILNPTSEPRLSLITCMPGAARRYVVYFKQTKQE